MHAMPGEQNKNRVKEKFESFITSSLLQLRYTLKMTT